MVHLIFDDDVEEREIHRSNSNQHNKIYWLHSLHPLQSAGSENVDAKMHGPRKRRADTMQERFVAKLTKWTVSNVSE